MIVVAAHHLRYVQRSRSGPLGARYRDHSTYPSRWLKTNTHTINPSYQHTSPHQHTLSTHPTNSLYQHTLFYTLPTTHPPYHLFSGAFAHPEHDAMPDYVDYESCNKEIMPISAAPAHKSSFVPSKWEMMKVMNDVQWRVFHVNTIIEKRRLHALWTLITPCSCFNTPYYDLSSHHVPLSALNIHIHTSLTYQPYQHTFY